MKIHTIAIYSFALLCLSLLTEKSFACRFDCESIPPIEDSLLKFGNASERSLSQKNIKLLVWNIYKGKKYWWAEHFERLSNDRDIILLQEMKSETHVYNSLRSLSHFTWEYAVSFLMDEDLSTGVISGSKTNTIFRKAVRSEGKEPLAGTPKMIMISKLPILESEQSLMLLNIHSLNFTNTKAFAEQLELTRAEILKHQGPVIFAGDFNTRNSKRHKVLNAFMSEFSLRKVSFDEDDRSLPLDHVYIRGLKVNTATLDEANGASDHPALLLDLSIQEN